MNEILVSDIKILGGDKCWYCGNKVYPEIDKTSDHFYPKSRGGRIKVVCCIRCNTIKKDMTPMLWLDFLKGVKETKRLGENYPYDRAIKATESLWIRIRDSVKEWY